MRGLNIFCRLAVSMYAILFGAALLFAAHAHASPSSATDTYLNDMSNAGFGNNGGNMAMLTVGKAICIDITNGTSTETEAHNLWYDSQLPSLDAARKWISITVQDLCPSTGT